MIERAHPPAGRFVEVSGGRLHIVDLDRRPQPAGDAPPLLLIHGASGNLEDMRLALGERLSARYRVILVDRPGHGWSDRTAEPDAASPAHQAAMLSEMLDRLGIDARDRYCAFLGWHGRDRAGARSSRQGRRTRIAGAGFASVAGRHRLVLPRRGGAAVWTAVCLYAGAAIG